MDADAFDAPHARRIALPGRGGEMAVLDFGPPDRAVDIVFSHANGFNARAYRSILAPLAGRLRILAPDLRGHGLSALPAEARDWAGWRGMASDLLALLEAAEIATPVILAGHSLGATSSLLVAGEAPARVGALVLFEPVLPDPPRTGADLREAGLIESARRRRAVFPDRAAALQAYRGRGVFAGWSDVQLADFVQDGLRETADGQVRLACDPAWEAAIYAGRDFDPVATVAAARCPIRLFAAGQGSTVGADALAQAARQGVAVETVEGAGHMLPFLRPDLVRQALAEAAGLRS
jgi:pimeloyl-ACP methyl ester carboxylesterase